MKTIRKVYSGTPAFDVPQIFEQILLRSENGLKELLMRYPDCLDEVMGPLGTTPLQLSCLWPHGLSILLNAGSNINAKDIWGKSPLYYACRSQCGESIRLLLDHDSGLGCNDDPNNCLSSICQIKDIYIRRSFISALVD
jgi:hypothetical protein